ncbi:phosphate acyltransferase PlsX [Eubacteriales bacterium OttesenSCG-928-K08]|nr:phosphate acyltransferase PlsX [Eubacteriales bacterium OttesenSCG-928-K08]
MYNIAIDVFGGDNAPQAILEGCELALGQLPDIRLLLFGDEAVIENFVRERGLDKSRVEIVHAPEIIGMAEKATAAIKQKQNSSLVRALKSVAEREAVCLVSAGSTGAVLAGATLIVRRIKGVKRPALAPFLPTRTGYALLLDCGANTDCKPAYLQQFAVMGSAYIKLAKGIKNPRVGLLNNGAEAEKGNELTKAAYPLLEQAPINFVGNCEARDVLSGEFDVIVADGFAGNVVLKSTEGVAGFLMATLKDELMSSARSKVGAALAKPAFSRLKKRMDYTEYGGALLIGANGGIVKAHGSSNAKAFAAAIRQAHEYARADVTQQVEQAILELEQV